MIRQNLFYSTSIAGEQNERSLRNQFHVKKCKIYPQVPTISTHQKIAKQDVCQKYELLETFSVEQGGGVCKNMSCKKQD